MNPQSDRIFAIGDIHGCAKTLQALLIQEINVQQQDTLIFLGDYIDRGPDSKAVMHIIMELKDKISNIICLMGNHEYMALQALQNGDSSAWLRNGGRQTIESFNCDSFSDFMNSTEIHIFWAFLNSLKYYHIENEFVLVHAGINCSLENPLMDTHAMLWQRGNQAIPEKLGGRKVICGHTPVSLQTMKDSLQEEQIFLDGGCVYPHKPWFGNLCALEINSKTLYHVRNCDNEAII